jgi:hypothetical protein
MLEALRELRTPQTFMMNTFFRNVEESSKEEVDVDIQKGQRRSAAYVKRREQGQQVDRIGFKTNSFTPPYMKPKMMCSADKLLNREPGEVIYAEDTSMEARASQKMTEDLIELDNLITRSEEIQAVQALVNDSIQILDSDGDQVEADISFGREASHDTTVSDLWNTAASEPIRDIRTKNSLNVKDSGVSSDIVVMGTNAADAFISNDDVRAYLDNRRFSTNSEIVMRAQELGVTWLGNIEGRDVFIYDEYFIDPADDTEKPLFPTDKVLIGSTRAYTVAAYGAINHMKAGMAAMKRFPYSWEIEDPSSNIVQLHSCPLMIPVQVDAFSVITVL